MQDYGPILTYIEEYWPRIVRHAPRLQGTLIGLPHSYLVPAVGAMFSEMYYWDSYFMALGLVGTAHEELIPGLAENLGSLYRRFGVIPNGSRLYFLSRSQPPFLTSLIWLAYEVLSGKDQAEATRFLGRLIRLAEREHETVWLGTAQPHHRRVYRGLSRYFDINYLDTLAACESGWDHSTRCEDRWLEHLPVDLNAILYVREIDFARAAELLGRPGAVAWRARAAERADVMQELMWDEEAGIFFDYDFVNERRTVHPSLAAFYPLWAGIATTEQAARIVKEWLPRFALPGGLVTTLEERAGRQWAYPNGWAPLQWIVVEGLDRYGFHEEATAIRRAWCDNCTAVFTATGVLWEKYNMAHTGTHAEGGLYGSVPGFGWTNAVFARFAQALAG
jgi:alpha,alpha-trehalase